MGSRRDFRRNGSRQMVPCAFGRFRISWFRDRKLHRSCRAGRRAKAAWGFARSGRRLIWHLPFQLPWFRESRVSGGVCDISDPGVESRKRSHTPAGCILAWCQSNLFRNRRRRAANKPVRRDQDCRCTQTSCKENVRLEAPISTNSVGNPP